MRIAQVAAPYEAVPPRLYGGTERIVAHLTDALVDLGHDVFLFANTTWQKAGFAQCFQALSVSTRNRLRLLLGSGVMSPGPG